MSTHEQHQFLKKEIYTHKELKVNTVVGVEILKDHSSGFLQAHGIGQRCSALVCVRGDVVTFRSPGGAGETDVRESAL